MPSHCDIFKPSTPENKEDVLQAQSTMSGDLRDPARNNHAKSVQTRWKIESTSCFTREEWLNDPTRERERGTFPHSLSVVESQVMTAYTLVLRTPGLLNPALGSGHRSTDLFGLTGASETFNGCADPHDGYPKAEKSFYV